MVLKKAGMGGIKGWYKSYSSLQSGRGWGSGGDSLTYKPLTFYCMRCGNPHNKIACPKCGSKAVRASWYTCKFKKGTRFITQGSKEELQTIATLLFSATEQLGNDACRIEVLTFLLPLMTEVNVHDEAFAIDFRTTHTTGDISKGIRLLSSISPSCNSHETHSFHSRVSYPSSPVQLIRLPSQPSFV
jgi:hypothetical protein